MPISDYLRELREVVGSRLLLLPAVAAVIRDDRGQILLLRRAESGRWSLPAGAVEPGESPAEAMIREVAEETGLHVTASRLSAAVGGADFRTEYPNGDQVEYVVSVLDCAVELQPPESVDGEASEFQWVAPSRVVGLIDLPYPADLFGAVP